MAAPEVARVQSGSRPLDPLSADEVRRAVGVLRRDRGVDERWRFASVELREPAKGELITGAGWPTTPASGASA